MQTEAEVLLSVLIQSFSNEKTGWVNFYNKDGNSILDAITEFLDRFAEKSDIVSQHVYGVENIDIISIAFSYHEDETDKLVTRLITTMDVIKPVKDKKDIVGYEEEQNAETSGSSSESIESEPLPDRPIDESEMVM